MATITSKFEVGDTVYRVYVNPERKRMPCPDCKGTRTWQAISPAGTGYIIACPRCSASYSSEPGLSLDYVEAEAFVQPFTIRSIRFESHGGGVSYCDGEHGGSILQESDAYATPEEAEPRRLAEKIKRQEQLEGKGSGWPTKKTIRLCDYQIPDARLRAEKARHSNLQWNVQSFLDDLGVAESLSEVIEHAKDRLGYEPDEDQSS